MLPGEAPHTWASELGWQRGRPCCAAPGLVLCCCSPLPHPRPLTCRCRPPTPPHLVGRAAMSSTTLSAAPCRAGCTASRRCWSGCWAGRATLRTTRRWCVCVSGWVWLCALDSACGAVCAGPAGWVLRGVSWLSVTAHTDSHAPGHTQPAHRHKQPHLHPHPHPHPQHRHMNVLRESGDAFDHITSMKCALWLAAQQHALCAAVG